jgi:hypothetical protein
MSHDLDAITGYPVSDGKQKTANQFSELLAGKTIRAKKALLEFQTNSKKCGACHWFQRNPAGQANRCRLGDFPSSINHGCSAFKNREVEAPIPTRHFPAGYPAQLKV